jgi:Na+-translocating ferredoxin:NAD+ oxidoreductase subunit G
MSSTPREFTAPAMALRTAAILFVFVIIFTALLSGAYLWTRPAIEASALEEKMKLLNEVLPAGDYDNTLLSNSLTLPPTAELGLKEPSTVYLAYKNGQPSAMIFEAAANDGYAGRIKLLIAIRHDGTVAGVRVTQHKETPGWATTSNRRKTKTRNAPGLPNSPAWRWPAHRTRRGASGKMVARLIITLVQPSARAPLPKPLSRRCIGPMANVTTSSREARNNDPRRTRHHRPQRPVETKYLPGQVLGLCPLLAVTTNMVNGVMLSLATIIVMALANVAVASLRNLIPHEIRIPVFILIVAALVTVVDLVFNANLHELYVVLGIFIPLIVTNCIVLARVEAFAAKNPPLNSTMDGIFMGLGMLWTWPCSVRCGNSSAAARCWVASTWCSRHSARSRCCPKAIQASCSACCRPAPSFCSAA